MAEARIWCPRCRAVVEPEGVRLRRAKHGIIWRWIAMHRCPTCRTVLDWTEEALEDADARPRA